MIHISLPLVYYNQDLNNYMRLMTDPFHKYTEYTNQQLKIPNLNIDSFHGSIPYFIYNGDINSNIKNEKLLTDKLLYLFFNNNNHNAPIRLNCANNYIIEDDLLNYYFNLVLQYGNNGTNFIEISDMALLDYINEKGYYYNFIFSKYAHLKCPFTIDIINNIIEQDIFYLIELPISFNNKIDFLNKIKNKNKIEITIGNKCPIDCNNIDKCNMQEQQYQINYSIQSVYNTCNIINNYNNTNELLNELQTFINLGFTHFKIDTPRLQDITKYNNYFIHNLIKEQYQILPI